MKRRGMMMVGLMIFFVGITISLLYIMPYFLKHERIDRETRELTYMLDRGIKITTAEWLSYITCRDKGLDCSQSWLGRIDTGWLSGGNYSWSGDFKTMFPDDLSGGGFDNCILTIAPVINGATGQPKTVTISGEEYPSEMLVGFSVPLDDLELFSRMKLKNFKSGKGYIVYTTSDDVVAEFRVN